MVNNAGYIYVLINPSMEGLLKVGKTTRDPEGRAKELSAATGIPTPFYLAYKAYFHDCTKAEQYVHARLEGMNYRLAANREFFRAPLDQAINTILEAYQQTRVDRQKKVNPVEFAKAIADETRQKIMGLCCCEELSVNEIVEQTSVSQPTVSHHLAILREAGLVDVRHEGKQAYYTLNQERMAMCCGQLMQVFAPESDVTAAVNEARKG